MSSGPGNTSRAIGKPIRRIEDPRLLAGKGCYVEDVEPSGVLHLAFTRSPYPSARITGLRTQAARAYPGVVAVATADDIPQIGDVPSMPLPFARIPPFPPLARGSVAAVGDPIVAIVADSAAAARDAAELVEVDFEPRPSVVSAEAALEADAPRVHPELDSNVCYVL